MTKKDLILDEGVLYHAANLVDRYDNNSLAALKLITDISYYCNRIIINEELAKKYTKHLKKLEQNRSPAINAVSKIFRDMFANQRKLKNWIYEVPPVQDESNLPADDIYLVRLANMSRAVLITPDHRLIEKLNPDKTGYCKKYEMYVLDIDSAINESGIAIR
jgi:hypothetical protein